MSNSLPTIGRDAYPANHYIYDDGMVDMSGAIKWFLIFCFVSVLIMVFFSISSRLSYNEGYAAGRATGRREVFDSIQPPVYYDFKTVEEIK